MRRALVRGLAVLCAAGLAVSVAACSNGDDDRGDGTTTSSSLVFTGDPAGPFCALLRDMALREVLGEPAASASDVEAGFSELLEILRRAAGSSPPELREDTALLLAGVGSLDDALRAVGYDYDALASSEAGPTVAAAVNDPAFGVAGDRIEAYKEQVCGL